MYIPKVFAETDVEAMHALVRACPLATLITRSDDSLEANHIPLVLVPDAGEHGSLQGHAPRANPLTSYRDDRTEVLAIFHGPDAYISPSWYPSKQQHGKVVPTWNYAVVHAYGYLEVIDDPAWIRNQVDALTQQNEAAFDRPWQVDDAPSEYTDKMIAALLGLEIRITRWLGKTKASQNQPADNRNGVIAGLGDSENPNDRQMAGLVPPGDDTE